DVDLGSLSAADLLADVEHRRLVALALADDDLALDVEAVQRGAHGVDRHLIGGPLVAAPDQLESGHGGGLGDADRFEDEAAVEGLEAHGTPFGTAYRRILRSGRCAT